MRKFGYSRAASGFTILELIVAIGIASIVMGIAIPSFLSWMPTLRLSSAARQVAMDLQVARMKAIAQNTANTGTFTSGTYTFTLSPGDSRNVGQLYPGITIAVSANPVFSPRGTISNASTVTITLSNGTATTRVCVKTVGRVDIQNSSTCT